MLSLIFYFFFLASAQEAPTYPTYEKEVNDVLALFNQDKLAPSYLRHKFTEVTSAKRKEVGDYDRKVRETLAKSQQEERATFEKAVRAESKEWQQKNAKKGDYKAFQKDIQERRKQMNDRLTQKRKDTELSLKTNRDQFHEFLNIRTQEFNKKLTDYSKNIDEQSKKAIVEDTPLEKEFKEIPKGPGIQLSPTKNQ